VKKDDWEVILTLHEYPNLTKASARLFLSQPALTKRLRQIEEEFGITIVNRNSKGVTFTPEGEYLAEQAQKYKAFLQDTKQHLSRMGEGDVGSIKIGSPTSFTKAVLPRILNRYHALYPKVDLRVQVAISGQIPKLVQQQEVHVGFANGDQQLSEAVEQFLCAVGQAYIVSNSPVTMEDLPKIPLIRFYRDDYSRNLVQNWWKNNFLEPLQVGMDVLDIDTCREMLRNGLGYSVVYSNYLQSSDTFFKLPMYNRDGSPVMRNTWMVYRKDYKSNPLIRNFVEFVRDSSVS